MVCARRATDRDYVLGFTIPPETSSNDFGSFELISRFDFECRRCDSYIL